MGKGSKQTCRREAIEWLISRRLRHAWLRCESALECALSYAGNVATAGEEARATPRPRARLTLTAAGARANIGVVVSGNAHFGATHALTNSVIVSYGRSTCTHARESKLSKRNARK